MIHDSVNVWMLAVWLCSSLACSRLSPCMYLPAFPVLGLACRIVKQGLLAILFAETVFGKCHFSHTLPFLQPGFPPARGVDFSGCQLEAWVLRTVKPVDDQKDQACRV